MISPEKENVKLKKPILVEPKVEEWIKKLQKGMIETLKGIFYDFGQKPKIGRAENKDKLSRHINDWPGQLLITMGQIHWTSEV